MRAIMLPMNRLGKLALVLVILLVLGAGAYIPFRGMLQFRAIYPGGLTFIGHADGVLDTQYYRVYLWRSPEDASPLPDVTVHLLGEPYALAALTEELMLSLGGTPDEGGIKDAADWYLTYRFENGRLTFFALAPSRARAPATHGEGAHDRFHLQMGGGPPFLLPVPYSRLVELAGTPQRIRRNIPN